VHLVGFIVRIYHDVRSPEHKKFVNCTSCHMNLHKLNKLYSLSDISYTVKYVSFSKFVISFRNAGIADSMMYLLSTLQH